MYLVGFSWTNSAEITKKLKPQLVNHITYNALLKMHRFILNWNNCVDVSNQMSEPGGMCNWVYRPDAYDSNAMYLMTAQTTLRYVLL